MLHAIESFLFRRLVLAGLAGGLLVESYVLLKPPDDRLGYLRRRLADRLSSRVVDDLPFREAGRSAAILHLAADNDGYLTELLRKKTQSSGKLRLLDDSFLKKLLREVPSGDTPAADLADAVARSRKLGVDIIIFGNVPEFRATEDYGVVRLELRAAERDSGQAVYANSYTEEIGGSTAYWRAHVADSSKWRRVLIWLGFALLLPVATAPWIRRLTAMDSNAVNFGMLAGYTLLDLLVAFALTGFWVATPWSAGLLVAALASSAYYNYRVAAFIDRLK